MITIDNYTDKIKGIDFASLPDTLQKGHEFVKKVTISFTGRSAYDTSPAIKKTVDIYFEKLENFLATQKKAPAKAEKKEPVPKAKTEAKEKVKQERQEKRAAPSKETEEEDVEYVERIPDELRFIRRYINMDGKKKTFDQILTFINSLQRAILEKRIRKSSPYAKAIEHIQDSLIASYNKRGRFQNLEVDLSPRRISEFRALIDKERIYKSVQFIKRFISLHGKTGVREKAQRLLQSMKRSVERRQIVKGDKYEVKLQEVYKLLVDFINDKDQNRIAMDKETLGGLIGVIKDCDCGGLDGIDVPEGYEEEEEMPPANDNHIMSSMDFANKEFVTIGIRGKWLELMGDPSPGFTAMVFGKPKMGKSTLCIEFAGYLSRNHGKVLYVAKEEGLDATLQKKLNDTNVKNPNLFVSDYLPDDLSEYQFIFLDSVNKLGLLQSDIDKLRKDNPGKSFIFVFQTTKDGNFKGKNEFQHDVDIVIEVYELGKASQFGRYNQGGQMDIFNN